MRRPTHVAVLAVAALAPVLAHAAPNVTKWTCATLAQASLGAGASWRRLHCTSPSVPGWGSPALTVNAVTADLTTPGLRLLPLTAPTAVSVATLDAIAKTAPPTAQVLAGTNGGYFWRVDSSSFFDGVCLFKLRADAVLPPDPTKPNQGIGDGSTVSGGARLSNNCDCLGYSRPTVFTINGSTPRIDVLSRGAQPPAGDALDSLAAGPRNVLTNASGTFVDVPADDDNLGNIYEWAANTGVGFAPNGTAWLVTTDGYDGCPAADHTCGANAFVLGYLLKDYFGATSAMGMDQGGSTTMFVAGQGRGGIVSNSSTDGGVRPVFNGLFLVRG